MNGDQWTTPTFCSYVSSQITTTSLCLINVFLAIPDVANLTYGYKPTLNIVVKNTSIAFTCKQLTSLSKRL